MDEFERNPSEFPLLPEEGNSCAGEPCTVQNEFDRTDEYGEGTAQQGRGASQQAKRKNRRSRFRSKLLLQAAAVMTAVVTVTASFNDDPLGSDAFFSGGALNSGILDEQLDQMDAKDGIITISMLWNTTDDMDLHVLTPSGDEIFFGNSWTEWGELDVDMQVGEPFVDNPVENIYFNNPERGTYTVWVDNFSDRTEGDTRVLVRIKIVGSRPQEYILMVGSSADVCTFRY